MVARAPTAIHGCQYGVLGATALTAITDNAAPHLSGFIGSGVGRFIQVRSGGRCRDRRRADHHCQRPNPAGASILKSQFHDESIHAGGLFLAALGPT